MCTELKDQIQEVFFKGMLGILMVFLIGVAGLQFAYCEEKVAQEPDNYYTVAPLTLSDGTLVDEFIIDSPPVPPPGFEIERQAAVTPTPDRASGINTLMVPAYRWVFGSSAVSAAMIAAYYDRLMWSNIYTGPTNGGVMPLDDSSWLLWGDMSNALYPSCPLAASKIGIDGRNSSFGSIDVYWVQKDSNAPDPYITNGWSQHAWGDAIGDYMKTSQSAFNNVDGATTFYSIVNSAHSLTCSNMETYGVQTKDGTYGRKLFYEARGYTVTDCYSQRTDNIVAGGFSFSQFMAEIDAGRPVMLNLEGHTVVGVGYDDSSNLIYIHDTWDYDTHTMTWGGSYSGMALQSVSIVNLYPCNVPGPFTFADQTNAELFTLKTSDQITVSQICAPAAISITGGAYSINGGPYTSSAGTVSNGDKVTVRLRSSASFSTPTNAVLTIGGVSDTFSVTTGSCAAYLTENFDSATPPSLPSNWDQADMIGTLAYWATAVSTVHPAGTAPHSGPNLAYFFCYASNWGDSTRLFRTSGIDLSGASGASAKFWMYHDAQYDNNDELQLQVSTNGGSSWANVGSAVSRFDGTNGWKEHSVDMSAYAGAGMNDVRLAFLGLSEYGNDIHLDDVSVACTCTPSSLRLAINGPTAGFSINQGSASAVSAIVKDNCGSAVTGATVTASFSFGEPSMTLYDDGAHGDGAAGDGTYGSTWTPAYSGGCDLTVTASKVAYSEGTESINGDVVNQPVRIAGKTPYYSSIQAAYDAAADGDSIEIQDLDFAEILSFDRTISVGLKGGYDLAFTNRSAYSWVQGALTISSGTVTADKMVIY